MRKQIAAANWKMNKTLQEGQSLLNDILSADISVSENQEVLFAVPFPYLIEANNMVNNRKNIHVTAQNCHHKTSGAYTGEVSVGMLSSIGIHFCLVGHSERREYFAESNQMLAEKVDLCLSSSITPVFCCGEPLSIRDAETQNQFVEQQLRESLFHLDAIAIQKWVTYTNFSGLEAWSEYRKTGLPVTPQSIQVPDSKRPVRFFYPNTESGANQANVTAQGTIDAFATRLFWDID